MDVDAATKRDRDGVSIVPTRSDSTVVSDATGFQGGFDSIVTRLGELYQFLSATKNRIDTLCEEARSKSEDFSREHEFFSKVEKARRRDRWAAVKFERLGDAFDTVTGYAAIVREQTSEIRTAADSGDTAHAQQLWTDLLRNTEDYREYALGVLWETEVLKTKFVQSEAFVTQVLDLFLRS